ncbi:hypothetical protein C359_01499 [Cryptococcus neoformans Bt120]|nr:hypothetical protein C359_01499 [Cryptococcus neoformans var. grubii Bt120]
MHTFVHLRVHYPGRIKDNKFFAEWLILADVGFRILVEWCFKKPFLPHSRNTAQFKRRGKNIVQHMALPLSQYPSSYTA